MIPSWFKVVLFIALMVIGVYETFTRPGALEQTAQMFIEDPIQASMFTLERFIAWEALTPVIPIGTLPDGRTIFLFFYSFWDTLILGFFGVMIIVGARIAGKWSGSRWNWVTLITILVCIWFIEKGMFHAMWINNSAAYGIDPIEADEMLVATSGLGTGILGWLNLLMAIFIFAILYGWVGSVG